jgi:hypothetical protein
MLVGCQTGLKNPILCLYFQMLGKAAANGCPDGFCETYKLWFGAPQKITKHSEHKATRPETGGFIVFW